ncbi:LysR substrate binding domain protein [compost metagenome]
MHDALLDGRLVQVLPEWQQPSRHVYAMFPQSRYLAPKVRALVEYARAYYAEPRWEIKM